MTGKLEYDVVVVGSGAGGMLAAIHAHDLGLRPIVIEKSDRYGGTSAVSGGAIWIPNNEFLNGKDSAAKALHYLKEVTESQVPEKKLKRYIDTAPKVVSYLKQIGIEYYVSPYISHPDYYPKAEGAMPGFTESRTMFVKPMDGGVLGDEFIRLRESYPEFKLLDRITLDLLEGGSLLARVKGWRWMLAKILVRYWTDFSWRRKTHRDRRLTLGNALVGGLRKAMLDRGIPLALKTSLTRLTVENSRVTGVVASSDGREIQIAAARGVILAAGGFEQSQELRNQHLPQKSNIRWSATPRDNNTGDAFKASLEVGADTEFLGEAWWAPTIGIPSKQAPNLIRNQGLFYERGYPHSMVVNRLGKRFINEVCSYHQFGKAMLKDNDTTGANLPCWMIFDAEFRQNYPLGGLLPGRVASDKSLPADWFDNFLYRADNLGELADKIGIPRDQLEQTAASFNKFALAGVDEEFGRGANAYNQYFGDPSHKPNRCLGTIAKGPFYAVRIDLGDLGTKGGPKTDEDAKVLSTSGVAIPGLYAIGNCAGSVMGPAYPGAGATLGSAMTFGYLAAESLARKKIAPV